MKTACNNQWATVDTSITLSLECVFQACIQEMEVPALDLDFQPKMLLKIKYREFLGLPLVMEIGNYHPCKISVAHGIHGRQMRTGWPTDRSPLSFRDRDDNFNNILIETWASNLLKQDFPERCYPSLRQMVLEVNMPRDMVDTGLTLPPANPEHKTLFSRLEEEELSRPKKKQKLIQRRRDAANPKIKSAEIIEDSGSDVEDGDDALEKADRESERESSPISELDDGALGGDLPVISSGAEDQEDELV